MVQTVQKPQTQVAGVSDVLPIVLKLSPIIELTDERFADFCGLNSDLRMERTANGELEIMAPAFSETGGREGEIFGQLWNWSKEDRSGSSFGPSAGFTLPNGAIRAPDASWILKAHLAALSHDQRRGFYNICPDFVIELRSETDRLGVLHAKMQEYIANGARLGWLIDPFDRRVYAYRPDRAIETLENPASVSAGSILPGFTLNLSEIWEWES